MGRKATKFDPISEKNRIKLSKFYNKNKFNYRVKYLINKFNINKDDFSHLETDEEKYLYCLEISNIIKLERIRNQIASN